MRGIGREKVRKFESRREIQIKKWHFEIFLFKIFAFVKTVEIYSVYLYENR